MIAQDHRYNNPVNVVFFELMLQQLRAFRMASAQRKVATFVSDSVIITPETAPTAKLSPLTKIDVTRRARNRWQLARMLLSTPALKQWRFGRRQNNAAVPLSTSEVRVEGFGLQAVKKGRGRAGVGLL